MQTQIWGRAFTWNQSKRGRSHLSIHAEGGCSSDRGSCIAPAVEERCRLHALRCIRERSHGSRSRRLLTPDGPRKEDLCQRCGSLPVLLAASAAPSQKRCLRQEIVWSRQPAIRSNLSSLGTGTPRKFVLSRWMLPMKPKPRRPSRRRLHPSETWTCSSTMPATVMCAPLKMRHSPTFEHRLRLTYLASSS